MHTWKKDIEGNICEITFNLIALLRIANQPKTDTKQKLEKQTYV